MKNAKITDLSEIFEYSPEEYTQQVNYSTDDFHYLVPTYLRRRNTEESISDDGVRELNEQQIGASMQYIPRDRDMLLDAPNPYNAKGRAHHGRAKHDRNNSVNRLYRKVSGMFAPRRKFSSI
ncbi:hypothetical protein FBU59_004393 [Linderina macrospora]|uniref:Uncharacterized protein n=1 Tax=Linderina macrospora TaxID=4868 RepID=A0ACC1J5P5_9FUNG|nr:hypothetical protein FBU59_004393 [Linderina macrospora]